MDRSDNALSPRTVDQAGTSRRRFLGLAATGAVAAAAGVPLRAEQHAGHGEHGPMDTGGSGGTDGYHLPSGTEQRCGTCNFWGGQRRLSPDGGEVIVGGLGWCNNPDSPNYQKLTAPDHGPMPAWVRWTVLR